MVKVAYFDTSALLEKYVIETGSRWVQSYITSRPVPQILTSSLTLIEASCAFARRLREGILTAATHITIEEAFDYEIQHRYMVMNFDPIVLKVADNWQENTHYEPTMPFIWQRLALLMNNWYKSRNRRSHLSALMIVCSPLPK